MENNRNKWIWLSLIIIMSGYVTYMHATDERAVDMERQIDRHERFMEGDSEFFNPWQYRVLSPLILQGFIETSKTLFPDQPEVLPYLTLHWLQLIAIFFLSLFYYQALGIQNPFVLWAGLMLISYGMASSTFASDLSFNTYFDIAFYLLAAQLILRGKYYWLIPVTFLAALNRETSAFIPLMLMIPFSRKKSNNKLQKLPVFGLSVLAFIIAFLGTRWYFGYQAAVGINGMTTPLEFLTFNLTFLKLYPLLIGTLAIVPILVLLNLGKLNHPHLKAWFWLIVPAWFVIHFIKSNAMETRTFLVPQVLIFVPAFLLLIERWGLKNHTKQG